MPRIPKRLLLMAALVATPLGFIGTSLAQETTPAAEEQAHAHDVSDLLEAAHEQCDIAHNALASLRANVTEAKHAKTLADVHSALQGLDPIVMQVAQHLGSCDDAVRLAQYAVSDAATHHSKGATGP